MTTERRQELQENLAGVEKLLIWQPDISSKEFAENFVYLPKTNAFDAGQKVKFFKSPHLIKPLECFDSIHTQEIWLMFASQMAKTLFLFIIWAKTAKLNPKSMVWMISKIEAIQRYQKEKIMDLVNASLELKTIIEESLEEQKKSRSKTGVIYHQGATTYLIGAKADDDKKSVTTKVVIVDEADEMDGVAAITPLWERAKTFLEAGAKLVVASTKKEKNGTITQGFNSCEQKNFLGMECPHCGELTEVKHQQFKIMEVGEFKSKFGYKDKELSEDTIYEEYIPYASKHAYYECAECGGKITNELKKKQITNLKIDWIVKGVKENPRTIGFSANSFLSFFVPYEDIAKSYLKAKMQSNESTRDDMLEKFFEGYLNEWYNPRGEGAARSDDILLLDSGIPKGEISKDCVAVYMTIDSQKGHNNPEDDHFWYVIGEFDKDLNWRKIESGKVYDEKKLYTLMHKKYNYEGKERRIRRVLWDIQGHGETEVLAFIQQVNKMVGQIYKYEKEERNYLVYPYRGKTEIQGKSFNLKVEKKQDSSLLEHSYPLIEGNAKRGKDELFRAISKSIKYRKGDEVKSPERRGWYIDETEALDGKKRYENRIEKNVKVPKASFEMQITSEVYGVMKNGKEGYDKLYEGADNHYLDCCYMQYIAKDFDILEERLMER